MDVAKKEKAEADSFPASAFSLLIVFYLALRFFDDCDALRLRAVCLLRLPTPESFLVVLLADTLLRERTPLVVLLADFVAAFMLWLRDFREPTRALADFVLDPLDLIIVGALDFLLVIDFVRDVFPLVFFELVDFGRVILPLVLLIDLLAVFPEALPVVFLEADVMERLFRMPMPLPPPFALIACMASQSLPNSLAL
jgi:hypothetical protein